MEFFGCKTTAWLDVWSLEHLITGICLGPLVAWLARRFVPGPAQPVRTQLLFLLVISQSWEVLEHYLETGLAGAVVAQWFQGVEFWGNRMITDPLCVLLGWLLYRHHTFLCWPARAFSLLWLGVHIFVFPHSMYLHTQFFHSCPIVSFTADCASATPSLLTD